MLYFQQFSFEHFTANLFQTLLGNTYLERSAFSSQDAERLGILLLGSA